MEVQEEGCGSSGWQGLPPELDDYILSLVVTYPRWQFEWIDDSQLQLSLLMDVVLCFVCRTWKERKPFWESPKALRDRFKSPHPSTKCLPAHVAVEIESIAMLKWLRRMDCPWQDSVCL